MERPSIRCVIMRGGTSKALFLREGDLPQDPALRDRVVLALFGSPDRRQIDGLGGADPLTSKLAIIGPPRSPAADVDYTFAQVEISEPVVDLRSLCGNISSAVGHYAVYEGLVRAVEPVTVVRAYNTNLDRLLRIEVPVKDGRPVDTGDYSIPGVPGTGARIQLDLGETAGGATGSLLPTGRPIDSLSVAGVGEIEASLVDIGNAHVFVRASDVGMRGDESPDAIDRDAALCERLERIRSAAAFRMGMISSPSRGKAESPATPIIGVVSPPRDYARYLGRGEVLADEVDLVSRLMYMQVAHKTYAGTSTACTGVAAHIPGTVVHEVLRAEARGAVSVRIGHPAGMIETESVLEFGPVGPRVLRATLGRTARRLMEGYAFVPDRVFAQAWHA